MHKPKLQLYPKHSNRLSMLCTSMQILSAACVSEIACRGTASKPQTSSLGLGAASPSKAAACKGCRSHPTASPLRAEVALREIPSIFATGQFGGIEIRIIKITAPLPHVPGHSTEPKWGLTLGQVNWLQRQLM